jgi:hypothetical protein
LAGIAQIEDRGFDADLGGATIEDVFDALARPSRTWAAVVGLM